MTTLLLNLVEHSYASDCFSSWCLGGLVLGSTVFMSGWPRMRRGEGQPENTDCKFLLFEIAGATFYSFFLFFLGE